MFIMPSLSSLDRKHSIPPYLQRCKPCEDIYFRAIKKSHTRPRVRVSSVALVLAHPNQPKVIRADSVMPPTDRGRATGPAGFGRLLQATCFKPYPKIRAVDQEPEYYAAGNVDTTQVAVCRLYRDACTVALEVQLHGPDDDCGYDDDHELDLSLIHISEPTRLRRISYAVFC